MKQKVREVIEENRALHEEIKRGTVQEILQEGLDVPGVGLFLMDDLALDI